MEHLDLSFADWWSVLIGYAPKYKSADPRTFRDYFDEGFAPQDAADEDRRNA